ncbi:nitroreductase family protein [Ornithinibacillus halotolerans]|uniref:NADH oxidoreductase n=1 Tax=Ornithinibacillus halotolerans TaxID=1274357 RepID=A0A916S7G0_9BACI|nr:nitroreductase family protein [Ornithinibacillus halotolerans]GGA85297.1 NADH oxidoreductase [Ornithinibacillus halotolerans]
MNVFEAIQNRREITKFEDRKIQENILEQVVDAGLFAPTGNNLPSKNLIVVQNRDMLDQLAETTPYMKWLKEATAGIVVTGKPNVSKYWLQDASFACAFIWLEAVEVGLGSAFGAVYHSEDQKETEKREGYVRDLLNIPDEQRIVAVLGLGYPSMTPDPKKHVPREEVVFYEKFGESSK